MTSQTFSPNGTDSRLIGSAARISASSATGSSPSRRSGINVRSGQAAQHRQVEGLSPGAPQVTLATAETTRERRPLMGGDAISHRA